MTTAGFTRQLPKAIADRIALERKIIRKLVQVALAWGNVISVHDGEEFCLKRSSSLTAIMNAIQSTDMDMLQIRNEYGTITGRVQCVYGNDGYDVISDYTVNDRMETIMNVVEAYASKFDK